jgi:hypothetical protein
MNEVKTQRIVPQRNKLTWKVRGLMRGFQAKQITLAAIGIAEVEELATRASVRPIKIRPALARARKF